VRTPNPSPLESLWKETEICSLLKLSISRGFHVTSFSSRCVYRLLVTLRVGLTWQSLVTVILLQLKRALPLIILDLVCISKCLRIFVSRRFPLSNWGTRFNISIYASKPFTQWRKQFSGMLRRVDHVSYRRFWGTYHLHHQGDKNRCTARLAVTSNSSTLRWHADAAFLHSLILLLVTANVDPSP
jgi:hypothetical protein